MIDLSPKERKHLTRDRIKPAYERDREHSMNDHLWDNHAFTSSLQHREVHVWRTWLDHSRDDLFQIKTYLSEDEVEISSKFHFERDRTRYVISHGILRKILSQYLTTPPETICFVRDEFGKPVLETNPKDLKFNLSHSEDMALFAFTRSYPIGVDIEYIHPIKDIQLIAKSFLSSEEMKAFLKLPKNIQPDSFFRVWTRKEALTKAIGTGITVPLEQLEVGVNPEESPRLKFSQTNNLKHTNWKLVDLYPADDYIATVAVEIPEISLSLFTYPAK